MDDRKGSSTVGGVGFVGMLTIAFIVLKLCKLITCSWWWVLSPIWISWGLVIIVALILYFVYKAAENKKW
jgi:hypothetical protein